MLSSCFADLAVGSTLFEVKTVSRTFESRDLRQLLVYLALQSATGEPRWDYGGLLKPRFSCVCTFSVDWLVTPSQPVDRQKLSLRTFYKLSLVILCTIVVFERRTIRVGPPYRLLIIWHILVRIIWHPFVPGVPRWPQEHLNPHIPQKMGLQHLDS